MREGEFYTLLGKDGRVQCYLCPKECKIDRDNVGQCRVRRNLKGKLIPLNYGLCTSIAIDPIEKKPLYHFYPGSRILSLGSFGCNLTCPFCQNWEISQEAADGHPLHPQQVVDILAREGKDCLGVAYTYSEPSVWYEFVLDTAGLVKEQGYANVLVTNGMLEQQPLLNLLKHVDALNIDVKGFTDRFYRQIGGKLEHVKTTVEVSLEAGKHVEITTLLIPGSNDSPEEIEGLCRWLGRLSPDIPLHFSRYFPRYQWREPQTPLHAMEEARCIGQNHLNYVYLGNLGLDQYATTYCPRCSEKLIVRTGYRVQIKTLDNGTCPHCGYQLSIRGLKNR